MTILHVKKRGDEIDPALISQHLERHGVGSEWIDLDPGGCSVGEGILDWCRANAPELVVMGAYEHSKFREDLFGGATNTMLNNMPSPILLAH